MATTRRAFKRPFQPSISSHFGQRDTDFSPTPTQTSILCPVLPATIQSSLLNVGMRVRKSVPEGYKTRPKSIPGPSMPFDGSSSQQDRYTTHTRSSSSDFTGLLPYCGILKAGGLDMQQPAPPAADLPLLRLDHDNWSLPSSQESAWSSMSNNSTFITAPLLLHIPAKNKNKRRREDADVEDPDLESQPVSPRSRPISHTRMPNLDQVRPIALPKTRRKVLQPEGIRESEMLDVEDFGEAEFFRPDEWGGGWGTWEECDVGYS